MTGPSRQQGGRGRGLRVPADRTVAPVTSEGSPVSPHRRLALWLFAVAVGTNVPTPLLLLASIPPDRARAPRSHGLRGLVRRRRRPSGPLQGELRGAVRRVAGDLDDGVWRWGLQIGRGPGRSAQHQGQWHDEEQDEQELYHLNGDQLDLEPAFRDAVVLALPMSPLCREDCSGLCADCGERLDDLPEDHTHDPVDARWGALAGLLPSATASTSTPDAPSAQPRTTEE